MPYTRKDPSRFPLQFFQIAERFDSTGGKELRIPLGDKRLATNFRWRLNDFRKALRDSGRGEEFPYYDSAVITLRDEGAGGWSVVLETVDTRFARSGVQSAVEKALRDYEGGGQGGHAPAATGQGTGGQVPAKPAPTEPAPAGQAPTTEDLFHEMFGIPKGTNPPAGGLDN